MGSHCNPIAKHKNLLPAEPLQYAIFAMPHSGQPDAWLEVLDAGISTTHNRGAKNRNLSTPHVPVLPNISPRTSHIHLPITEKLVLTASESLNTAGVILDPIASNLKSHVQGDNTVMPSGLHTGHKSQDESKKSSSHVSRTPSTANNLARGKDSKSHMSKVIPSLITDFMQDVLPPPAEAADSVKYEMALRSNEEHRKDSDTVPLMSGVHGATSKVAEKRKITRKWDWDALPKLGTHVLNKVDDKHNVATVQIDGALKKVLYNPAHNKRLSEIDFFLSFNMDSLTKDCFLNSKKRLKSYVEFLTEYLKSREYALECYPFNVLQNFKTEAITSAYQPYNPSHDFSEIEIMLQMWLYQAQKFILQSNSLIFASEVVQELLQQKSSSRKQSTASALLRKQLLGNMSKSRITDFGSKMSYSSGMPSPLSSSPKQSSSPGGYNYSAPHSPKQMEQTLKKHIADSFADSQNPLDDVDVLVLRDSHSSHLGLQLAYDEPSLNIADFVLDLSPWKIVTTGGNFDNTNELYETKPTTNIVSDKKDIKELNMDNAATCILDCMDRNYFLPRRDSDNSVSMYSDENTLHESLVNVDETASNPLGMSKSSLANAFPSLEQALGNKKKKNSLKSSRRTGFVNFFRRKHTQPSSISNAVSDIQSVASSVQSKDDRNDQVSVISQSDINREGEVETKPKRENKNESHNVGKDPDAQYHSDDDDMGIHVCEEPVFGHQYEGTRIQNAWLEDYFAKVLSNYRKIALPTNFLVPSEVLGKAIDDQGGEATNKTKVETYGREYLQVSLPFASDSIPTIFCPHIWSIMTFNKWKSLIREIYRCLAPDGYVVVLTEDLRVSNSFSAEDSFNKSSGSIEFESTIGRDKSFDEISLDAINKGLHIHPTRHLTKAFKDNGFTNIKSSVLSLKVGDLHTEMGSLNEYISMINWDAAIRRLNVDFSDQGKSGISMSHLIKQYFDEHLNKIDESAGCWRIIYLIAKKPKTTSQN